MTIRIIPPRIKIPGKLSCWYKTADGEEFSSLEEAVEHENKINEDRRPKPTYDYVTSIQQAINMAVAENRVVRFIWEKDNDSIRKEVEDPKGCRLRKPYKEAKEIAVVPESQEKTFTFEEVK